MNNSNIKVYLGISFALIVLFILILVLPFSKPVTRHQQPVTNLPTPTSVETNPSPDTNNQSPISVPADFTGVAEEQLPKQVINLTTQKKDLRQKTPLSLSTFTIDFDYGEDKFIVTFEDSKDQAQKEFESWRTTNYPGLGTEQFLVR